MPDAEVRDKLFPLLPRFLHQLNNPSLLPPPFDESHQGPHFFRSTSIMPHLASTSLRQASRLCLQSRASSTGLLRSSPLVIRAAGIPEQRTSRRTYVSESKRDNAQVNIDTTIRADQKAFFQETGKLPESQIVSGTNVSADAMLSPMAGMLLISSQRGWQITHR